MVERGINVTDLYRILRNGHVDETPILTEQKEWKCKVVYRLHGRRDAAAVTIIMDNSELLIKTVYWEDVS